MKDLHESWIEYQGFGESQADYLNGILHFRERLKEDIFGIEDRLYEDSDTTTPKELLWEIIGIIDNLKVKEDGKGKEK